MCAHRGASLALEDNSIEAFTAAIAAGCDMLETDVRMGRHGRLVLAHDPEDVDDPDVVGVRRLSERADIGLVAVAPFDGDPLAAAAGCGATVTLVEDELASPELLRLAGNARLPFWVWTVNDADRLAELFAAPAVTGVITDDPALAVAVRAATP